MACALLPYSALSLSSRNLGILLPALTPAVEVDGIHYRLAPHSAARFDDMLTIAAVFRWMVARSLVIHFFVGEFFGIGAFAHFFKIPSTPHSITRAHCRAKRSGVRSGILLRASAYCSLIP